MFGMGTMNNIFGGGSGGIGSSASSSPFANAAASSAPTIQPAGGRKYNAFMDPDAGGLPGLLGMITGSPTRDQAQSQGAARAIAGLAQLIESGVPAPQALNQFIQTPEGMEAFSSAEGFAAIEGYLKTQAAQGYAPNTQFRDMVGGAMGQDVPGAEEQNRQAMIAGATMGDPPEVKAAKAKALYDASILTTMYGDPTQTEKATRRLFDMGLIDEVTMELTNAGVLEVTTDSVHGGYAVTDKSGVRPTLFFDAEGGVTVGPQLSAAHAQTMTSGAGAPQVPQAPGAMPIADTEPAPAAPVAIPPPANYDPGSGYFGIDPEAGPTIDVMNTAGIANSVEGILSGWWGQIDPTLAGQDVASRNAIADLIHFDMMAGVGSGERQSTFIQKKIDKLSETGIGDNPVAYATRLLELRKSFESTAKMAMTELRKPMLLKGTREGLTDDIQRIRRSLQNVPPVPVLEAAIAAGAEGQGALPAGIQKLGEIYQDVESGAADAISGALDAVGAPKIPIATFSDGPSLKKAYADRLIKDGDTIEYNGEWFTIPPGGPR